VIADNDKKIREISNKRYIVVEGPIGVGKTSLAKQLASSFGSELMLEDAVSNPFLERYYNNSVQAAFPTQLFFLFQRAQQLQDMRQSDMFNPVIVADFLLEKDRLFAELTLDNDELELYQQIFDKLDVHAPAPDLVVYLQAPASVLRQRIHNRGLAIESRISAEYLTEVANAYARFFHDYQASPLLIVNAEEIDPAHNSLDYEILKTRILEVDSGRHYFNPIPISA